jgi:hypothetical protein
MPLEPQKLLLPELLSDLSRPDLTLEEIGDRRECSLADLAARLTRPDAREAIENLETLAAARVRLGALAFLPRAIDALVTMIEAYTHHASRTPVREGAPIAELQRQNARRACNLLMRLARFSTTPSGAPGGPPLRGGTQHPTTDSPILNTENNPPKSIPVPTTPPLSHSATFLPTTSPLPPSPHSTNQQAVPIRIMHPDLTLGHVPRSSALEDHAGGNDAGRPERRTVEPPAIAQPAPEQLFPQHINIAAVHVQQNSLGPGVDGPARPSEHDVRRPTPHPLPAQDTIGSPQAVPASKPQPLIETRRSLNVDDMHHRDNTPNTRKIITRSG